MGSAEVIVEAYEATYDVTQAYAQSSTQFWEDMQHQVYVKKYDDRLRELGDPNVQEYQDLVAAKAAEIDEKYIQPGEYIDMMTSRLNEEGYNVTRKEVVKIANSFGFSSTGGTGQGTGGADAIDNLKKITELNSWITENKLTVANNKLEEAKNYAAELARISEAYNVKAQDNAAAAVTATQAAAEQKAQEAIAASKTSAEEYLTESKSQQSMALAKAAASGTTLSGSTSLYLESLEQAAQATANDILAQGQKAATKQREIGSSAKATILEAGTAASESSFNESQAAIESIINSVSIEMESVLEASSNEQDILRTESAIASLSEAAWGKTSATSTSNATKWQLQNI